MKILNREQIRQADIYTINNEPIASIDLMERASRAFTCNFALHFDHSFKVHIFCGTGNNGGDGLAVSRMLLDQKHSVKTYIVHYSDNFTDDFKINLERLKKCKNSMIIPVDNEKISFTPDSCDIIIDALWGTGLTRPVSGFATGIIEKINNSNATIVSLDIPSGLYCDEFNLDSSIITACMTFTFQFPKYSFFIPENEKYVGKFEILDIGISREYVSKLDTDHFYTVEKDIKSLLKKRKVFAHKGNFGHALLISGSYGKIGAAILGSKSCLHCGVGLLTTYVPGCGYEIIQTAIPEAMVITDKDHSKISDIPETKPYQAIGIGPGIGQNPETAKALKELFNVYRKPLVIDADAINLIATDNNLISRIPANSILTPHIGEFERLTGKCSDQYERLEKLKDFSVKYNCIVVLKGAYTAIATPEGKIHFNSTGNPGMATAGSGDVLTGIITSFLAQGYEPAEAAKIGVYIHGLAGDLASKKFTQHAMISGDIIEMLPDAFKQLS